MATLAFLHLFILIGRVVGATTGPSLRICPCADPAQCEPVQQKHEREIFGFTIPPNLQFQHYNWSLLTTVARMWSGPSYDTQLVCAAHAAGARAVMVAPDVAQGLRNASSWVDKQIAEMQRTYMDGLNFDYEVPMQLGSEDSRLYSQLVRLTAMRLHALGDHYQVSVDVPWSPYDIDGRNYDWLGIVEHVDLLFVMAYDTQSQIWGRCSASANSPPALVERGVRQWLDLGVPANKIVLGLPWYAYMYECQPDAAGRPPPPDVDACMLRPVPFQGATCSDAAGAQNDFSFYAHMLRAGRNTTPVLWDPALRAYHFNFVGDPRAGVDTSRWREQRRAGQDQHAAGGGLAHHDDGSARGEDVLAEARAAGSATAAATAATAAAAAAAAGRGGADAVPKRSLAAKALQRSALTSAAVSHDLRAKEGSTADKVYQVWYDPPDSMREKYAIAKALGLRGIGFWHLEALAHGSGDPLVAAETAAHWDAVAEFLAA